MEEVVYIGETTYISGISSRLDDYGLTRSKVVLLLRVQPWLRSLSRLRARRPILMCFKESWRVQIQG